MGSQSVKKITQKGLYSLLLSSWILTFPNIPSQNQHFTLTTSAIFGVNPSQQKVSGKKEILGNKFKTPLYKLKGAKGTRDYQRFFFAAKATLCGRWPQPTVCTPRLDSEETVGNCSVHDGGDETFKLRFVHTEISSH